MCRIPFAAVSPPSLSDRIQYADQRALDVPKRTVERYIAKALEHCVRRLAPESG